MNNHVPTKQTCYKCKQPADKKISDDEEDIFDVSICNECADELLAAAVLGDYFNNYEQE